MAGPDKSVSLKSGAEPQFLYFESTLFPEFEPAELTWAEAPGAVCCMRATRWELAKRWIVELIRPAKKRERLRRQRELIELLERRLEAWGAK